MKQSRKSIEIAFEIARVFVFGSNWRNCAEWCSDCESYVPMVTTSTAATLEKTGIAEIFRRAETGELHHKLTVKDTLLICLSSLLDTSREQDKRNLSFDEDTDADEKITKADVKNHLVQVRIDADSAVRRFEYK